jgi:hypothetical protein
MDQGASARHGAEAKPDRWLGRSEGAEINPVEGGTGDDGVQIVGAVPLVTAVAGATMSRDPWAVAVGRGGLAGPTHHASGQGGGHSP